jgi:hypothetical protein
MSVSFGQSSTPVSTSLLVEDLQQNNFFFTTPYPRISMDFEIKNFPDIAIKNLTESSQPAQPILLPGTPVSWHGSEGICSKRHGLSTPLSAPSTASTSHEAQEVGSLEMGKLI